MEEKNEEPVNFEEDLKKIQGNKKGKEKNRNKKKKILKNYFLSLYDKELFEPGKIKMINLYSISIVI